MLQLFKNEHTVIPKHDLKKVLDMILPLMETINQNILNKQTKKKKPVLASDAIIKYHRLSGLIIKIYFSQFRRLRSPQSECQ